jgi:hypothetical protein
VRDADVQAAFSQAWPAFALVAGLLLAGACAAEEGLFAAAGRRAVRSRCSPASCSSWRE